MSMNPRLSPRRTTSPLLVWNMPLHTDRTIAANSLVIALKSKKDKSRLLVDMTTPLNTNTSVKATEKLNKYTDLEIKVE